MRFILICLCTLSAILFLELGSHAQNPGQIRSVYETVGKCVETARTRLTSDAASDLLQFTKNDLDQLNDKLKSVRSKELSDEYIKSLKGHCDLLVKAAKGNTSTDEAMRILTFVQRDVSTKLKAADLTANAAESLTSSIPISIVTIKDDNVVNGYIVKCNPAISGKTSSSRFPFNGETSPSTRPLAPGYYILWIEDKKGNSLVSLDLTVGDTNTTRLEIRLP